VAAQFLLLFVLSCRGLIGIDDERPAVGLSDGDTRVDQLRRAIVVRDQLIELEVEVGVTLAELLM
jgi:hypothetical protein